MTHESIESGSEAPAPAPRSLRPLLRWTGFGLAAVLIAIGVIMWLFDTTPPVFDPVAINAERAKERGQPVVIGQTLVQTEIELVRQLLDKRGGYLRNDILPPGVFMDNMPNWELGVLLQVRDLSRFLRNDFSRSPGQTADDRDLVDAEPHFAFSHDRWLLPSSESEYRAGIERTEAYLQRLADNDPMDARFSARADNLSRYLADVERRLADLSKRLSESVARAAPVQPMNPGIGATLPNPVAPEPPKATSWTAIDDVFYEARGACFAQIHILKAIDHDFAHVLDERDAHFALQQVIRELEGTQTGVASPVILNGSPYGFFANHSLVMANYISRANVAIGDLRVALEPQ